MARQRYYVVWAGREPGIYTTWAECKAQTEGHSGARYKSFGTREEAEQAYASPPAPIHRGSHRRASLQNPPDYRQDTVLPLPKEVSADAWAVDAACSGNPGMMEYRAVDLSSGAEVFHLQPTWGTNNIGEFLAIVHALALIKQKGLDKAIYTDSRNALLWIKAKQCKTKLARTRKSERVYDFIARAERWLKSNEWDTRILKWSTSKWGEIPADFGRK